MSAGFRAAIAVRSRLDRPDDRPRACPRNRRDDCIWTLVGFRWSAIAQRTAYSRGDAEILVGAACGRPSVRRTMLPDADTVYSSRGRPQAAPTRTLRALRGSACKKTSAPPHGRHMRLPCRSRRTAVWQRVRYALPGGCCFLQRAGARSGSLGLAYPHGPMLLRANLHPVQGSRR